MRLVVSLSLALLALGVQPSSGLSFQHLIRTFGRDGRLTLTQQDETQSQAQAQVVDPKLPSNEAELAFYNDPHAGDVIHQQALVEADVSVRDTSYKVGDAIYAKQVQRGQKNEVMYQFTLGACLQREKTWKQDNKLPFGTSYRRDSALTTIHDFFEKPMEAIFRLPKAADDAAVPNPYATVVDRKWFPDGDYTRIQFKPRAECACFNAKSGSSKWPTMDAFQKHMSALNLKKSVENAYFIGFVSKKKEFHFVGAVKKLELDPKDNNHPRGSLGYQDHLGHRTSYDQNAHPQHDDKAPASIEMFDVKVTSAHGDSGAGLYIKQLDKQGQQIPHAPDLLIGILSGATDNDDYTKFTPVWNIKWPENYVVC